MYELIRLSRKAADQWRNSDAYHQAAVLIDSLCDRLENADPVVHARWECIDVLGENPYCCTACGDSVSVYGYKRCPHCGADMRDIPTKSLSPEGQKLYDTLLARVKIDGGADNG